MRRKGFMSRAGSVRRRYRSGLTPKRALKDLVKASWDWKVYSRAILPTGSSVSANFRAASDSLRFRTYSPGGRPAAREKSLQKWYSEYPAALAADSMMKVFRR